MGTFNTAKMQDLRNLNTDGPTVEELASAPFPLMLLAGEKDAVLSPATVRRAGELLPSARVEVVTGAPHSMYWETPQLFNDTVASFLKDVAAAEPRARETKKMPSAPHPRHRRHLPLHASYLSARSRVADDLAGHVWVGGAHRTAGVVDDVVDGAGTAEVDREQVVHLDARRDRDLEGM